MPQTAGDTDNSDDTDTDSDAIVVVDSSCASSDFSFVRVSSASIISSTSLIGSECLSISYTDTIPETESDIDINENTDSSDSIMDNLVNTPMKRKHDGYPITTRNQYLRTDASPLPSCNVITTRSGRAVRKRIDHKFDYSSEQHDDDTDDSNDPDFADHVDASNDDDDNDNDDDEDYVEENDDDYSQQEQKESGRSRRRISMHSSCCSSSDESSTMLETDTIIYLDLMQPVAIVNTEPMADADVEHDTELKTRLQKFLGLVAPQRRLYNPMDNYDLDDNQMDEKERSPVQRSRLWSLTTSNDQLPSPQAKSLARPLSRHPKSPRSEITNDMKMLLIDHMVQRVNANYFESQTPQHIKEPIDLSGLPSVEHREQICQKHKKICSSTLPHSGLYGFVDSLKSTTPLNMCHPLALNFRKSEFETCKAQLAKTLFHTLNHTIFHCGLRLRIAWESSMSTPSALTHRIEAGGQRVSSIVLSQNIKQSGLMVKALLHEMCHAAAFTYHGEIGHGDNCRKWAYRAKSVLPELPEIGDCNASYKYTCLLCRGRSFGNIKFEHEASQLRCHYCQFEVNVEPCSDEDIHNLSLTDQLITPYKQFIRTNYVKCEQGSHSAKMRVLNVLYKEQQHQTSTS
ncbi:GH12779 [Drosophila grimshawi]|uniref:GH12779 n=2 Tax=Drosophila grimshawi TaxID=7222 RepID=B4JL31_DROGR|nr:GH12779 [Drosophila grimshawi]